jgi:hypothetical protein
MRYDIIDMYQGVAYKTVVQKSTFIIYSDCLFWHQKRILNSEILREPFTKMKLGIFTL